MAPGPIISWKIEVEKVTDIIFLAFKITADGDCNHKTKRYLLLGKKAMTNIDSILKKQRHHFANKSLYSQRVMHGCENWTIKKAKRQRIDAFKLWC